MLSLSRRCRHFRIQATRNSSCIIIVLLLSLVIFFLTYGDGLRRIGLADDDYDEPVTTPPPDDYENDKEGDVEQVKDDVKEEDGDDENEEKCVGAQCTEKIPATGSGRNDSICDKECKSLVDQMRTSWPANKPKAVIYYLIHRPALKNLGKSFKALDNNFNRQYQYPIVVFVEEDLNNPADRDRIRRMTDSSLFIQVVHFDIPPYVNRTQVPRMAGFGARKRTIGYRHMCRFHAGGVYEQPIMMASGVQYGWRLDDDSVLRHRIGYDLFAYMRDRGLQYGYHKINHGWSPVDVALWDAVDDYIKRTPSLTPTFYHQWPKNSARYFNNFEVSDLRVWMSKPYRDYFSFVDHLGGIYYYKWGDAAIKTIGVTLFIPRNKTHLFDDVAYMHT